MNKHFDLVNKIESVNDDINMVYNQLIYSLPDHTGLSASAIYETLEFDYPYKLIACYLDSSDFTDINDAINATLDD